MLKRIVIFFYIFSFFSNAQDISKVNLSSEKSIVDFFDDYRTKNFDPLIGVWGKVLGAVEEFILRPLNILTRFLFNLKST